MNTPLTLTIESDAELTALRMALRHYESYMREQRLDSDEDLRDVYEYVAGMIAALEPRR